MASRPEPGRGTPVTFEAADGYLLGGRLFAPAESPPRATVLIAGALAVPQRFYGRYAAYLASRGLLALTFDYRGIGASRPNRLRGFPATLANWGALDLAAAISWLRARHREARCWMVAHSFGGQALGLTERCWELDGAVVVSSGSGSWRHWSGLARLRVAVLWYALLPALSRGLGYIPSRLGLGEDIPGRVALDWARWSRHPDYLVGVRPRSRQVYAGFRSPILALSFTDDPFVPRPSVEALLGWLSGAQVEHRRLHPAEVGLRAVGHFGFFREAGRDRLWPESCRWILEHDEGGGGEAPGS